jgi:hypothetical protein
MKLTTNNSINSLLIFGLLISLGLSCTNPKIKENNTDETKQRLDRKVLPVHFEMINEVKTETPGKAQLVEYAVYTDSVYTEEALKNTVMDIYNRNKDKDVFSNHDRATVMGAYLFTSREAYKDKADWIAMLIKGPMDSEPTVSYNSFKITALNNVGDDVKSKDEIALEKLNSYLKKRGLELCSLSDLLKKIELDNIHKADSAHPDFGPEHQAMVDRLDNQSYAELKRKYNLSEDKLTEVSVFAMSYCK